MFIETENLLCITISELDRHDPIRVVIQNYDLGQGRIIITEFNCAWCAAWFHMSDRTVQQFFYDCDDDYLINCLTSNDKKLIGSEKLFKSRIQAIKSAFEKQKIVTPKTS